MGAVLDNQAVLCGDDDRPFECLSCQNGCICLRWHRTVLLPLSTTDVGCALECLEEVLQRPSCSFWLGAESFFASHGRDGHYYLLCKDRVVLRLSADDARGLCRALASVLAGSEPPQAIAMG